MSDKQQQPAAEGRRVVFFDLDGTLHQEDMFGSFLRFLLRRLPLNLLLVIPLLLPIGLALLLLGRAARWPMSLLLWAITFGRSEAKLKALERQFIEVFRQKVTAFPVVQMRLRQYGGARCRSVADYRLAGAAGGAGVSRFGVSAAGTVDRQPHHAPLRRWVLTLRCTGAQKVVQLEQRLGAPLKLYSGYSDSKQDNPLLFFCEHRWRVSKQGELQQLE